MPFSINDNSSLTNQRELNKTTRDLQKTFNRLSSGKRINSASDDPAGLQIAELLRATESSYAVAIRNSNDAVSMLSIGDSALESAGTIAERMSELASQAASGTLSDGQRSAINEEFQALRSELDRISANAQFNGQSVFGTTTIQTGTDGSAASQTYVSVNGVDSTNLSLNDVDLSTQEGARAALDRTTEAVQTIAASRGTVGAAEARLSTVISNNRTQQIAASEARSTIEDADIAAESARLVQNKIRQNAQISLAALSNLQPELALKLLG